MTSREEIERLLINGRTPEEIVEANRHCSRCFCDECAYSNAIECQTDLRRDCVALVKHLEAKQPKWISVKERLPEEDGEYLVLKIHNYRKDDGYMAQEVALFLQTRDPEWVIGNLCEVTHWMYLPQPPKEEE